MKQEIRQYGLIIPEIITREQGVEHILGALDKPIINPSGNWIPYLPEKEPQNKNGVETFSCAIYATLNALETLLKFKGYDVNYSDRYIALEGKRLGKIDILKDHGSDPHKIAELIRTTTGLLREDKLPFSDDIKSLDDYYNVAESILFDLFKEGQAWYKDWQLEHEWIFQGGKPNEKRLQIQQALPKGTVCASVSAWYFNGQMYYKPEGSTDNHWTQVAAAPVEKYVNFDSYDSYQKDLDPLYDFQIAKVYYLSEVQITPQEISIYQKILNFIKQILNLMTQENTPKPEPVIIPPPPQTPQIEPILSNKWDTPAKARHEIRVICDSKGLSVAEKNHICQVINCESGFDINAIHHNNNGTSDYSLCQYNSKWWVGEGKPFLSKEDVYNNPKKQIEIMIEEYKAGRLNQWVCYKTLKYKLFNA